MNVNIKLKMTKGQEAAYKAVHDSSNKYLTLVWSRQSGKTVWAELILIEYLMKRDKFSAYISPTYSLGRQVYKNIVKLLKPTNMILKQNSATLTIETIFGSTLQFFSVDAYTSIRGNTVSGILICDEAAYYPTVLPNGEQIWDNVIMPITKARCRHVVFISTPHGKSGFFYEMYKRSLECENKGGHKYRHLTRTIDDDELVTEEQREEIRKTISPLAYRQEFLCEWIDDGNSVFEGFPACFKPMVYANTKTWGGLDLSSVGEDDTILTFINEQQHTKQYLITGNTMNEKYDKIAHYINNQPNLQYVYVEMNGVGAPIFEEIRKRLNVKYRLKEWQTTNATKMDIIDALAVEIQNERITFDEHNEMLYHQLGTFGYTLTKTKKVSYAAMGSNHDDTVMSMAIALKAKRDARANRQGAGVVFT
jgi:hypothetical protein